MAFEIFYTPECVDSLKKLDRPTLRRIQHSIESRLSGSPFEYGKPLRHSAHGLWTLRVGDWRVIYQVNKEVVWVIKVGHRREVYKLL